MDKVLFWDFHGTLTWADSLWSKSLYQAALAFAPDCGITLQQVRGCLDNDGFPWHHPEKTYLDITEPANWWNYVNQLFFTTCRRLGLTDAEACQIVPQVRARVLDLGNYQLFDSAVQALSDLQRNGWRHIILSNNFPELPDICLGLGIGSFFEEYIVSARVGYDKPRLEIFRLALDAAGSPQTCFMIGDNPEVDIIGAQAAGIPGILVNCRKPDGAAARQAAFRCQDLGQLSALLNNLPSNLLA